MVPFHKNKVEKKKHWMAVAIQKKNVRVSVFRCGAGCGVVPKSAISVMVRVGVPSSLKPAPYI